jgi:hypothetical protein
MHEYHNHKNYKLVVLQGGTRNMALHVQVLGKHEMTWTMSTDKQLQLQLQLKLNLSATEQAMPLLCTDTVIAMRAHATQYLRT